MKSRVLVLTLLCVFLAGFSAPVSAKDSWVRVRSKNFHLLGNASEKDIRLVATKLEQFRETFRMIFPRLKLTQSIQTNVIVFKDDAAYRPFKPKDARGKTIDSIAGYFQPGNDVNYITIAIDKKEMADTYGTIFHEYVHYLLEANFGKSDIPPWFNEGLAEYYQTFKIENDQKVSLGIFQEGHLFLLQQNALMPLRQFFEIDNYTLHQSGNHSRSIFYAQAWALIHYMIQSKNGSTVGLNNFLNLVLAGTPTEAAFKQTFQMDYATLEKALTNYVAQKKYQLSVLTFKEKLTFATQMTAEPMAESEANTYLGDLLYHTREYADSETYLKAALAADPNSSFANTSLGLVRMHQRNFAEAKVYLEKAIAANASNPFAHYNYAYALSREAMDEFGYVRSYPTALADKIKAALTRAIELNPEFSPSYELMSFVLMVNNEKLDEAIAMIRKAQSFDPRNERLEYNLAQIYLRQQKLTEAKAIAERLYKSAANEEFRQQARQLVERISEYEERTASNKRRPEVEVAEEGESERPILLKRDGSKPLSEEEVIRINKENENLSLNTFIKRPAAGEAEAVGYLDRVACVKGEINYTFRTETETFLLTSKDFSNLDLTAMVEGAEGVSFGCDADVKRFKIVAAYSTAKAPNPKSRGTLLRLTFVPADFVRLTEEQVKNTRRKVIVTDGPPTGEGSGGEVAGGVVDTSEDFEKRRREAMLESIRRSIRQPGPGESRVFGFIEKIECTNGAFVFVVKTEEMTLKLKTRQPRMRSFTPEASGITFSCREAPPKVNGFFIFKGGYLDPGDLISIEFVPPSFKPE